MDFVMKQALGGATKDMGKMLGGDEEKDPDAAKKEEERQEALRQQEEERKAKYAKMEAEREVMRQGIRDKGSGKLDQQQSDVEQEGKMQSPAHGEEKIHTLWMTTSWTAALHRRTWGSQADHEPAVSPQGGSGTRAASRLETECLLTINK
ncbi:complexin-1 [Taeniopygia guttata]|uniref:Complexin-1 n=1 Tax=Taeniopygia guttata TaxID=59729 RepID=B5FXE2_TAEGU|nr:complexin-1 [Taeniopygia guttata]ACH43703.1 putative complexin 1 [Taeniopygia guttata]